MRCDGREVRVAGGMSRVFILISCALMIIVRN